MISCLGRGKVERNNFVKKEKDKKIQLSLHLGKTLELLHKKTNHQKPRTQISFLGLQHLRLLAPRQSLADSHRKL